MARIAVFLSGGGSNLQALLDRFAGRSDIRIALVVTDRAEAGGLERARSAGVASQVISVAGRPAAAVTADTLDALGAADIDVVALAGYLKLLPSEVVRRYAHRILNIHPALLPGFGGKGMYGRRVHEAVLAAGVGVTGPTVHFVTERYDEGRILAQWPVPVLPGDTPETLGERVLRVEHVLYPAAVEWLARALAVAGGEAVAAPSPGSLLPGLKSGAGGRVAFRAVEGEAADPDGIRRMFETD